MTLSDRATKYFSKLKRFDEWCLTKIETIQYFKNQNFLINQKLLNTQTNFSGYQLTITNDKGNGFLLRLFSKADLKNNNKIEVYHFGDMYVVDFGEHTSAQFNFYITNSGEPCTLGHLDGDVPNIICSSVERFIEQCALKDELALQTKNPYYHDVLNKEELTKLLERDFTKIEECSDKYSQWFKNGQLTIDKGMWLDRPEFYLHVYGQTKEDCDKFVDYLKHIKIIT